MTHDRRDPPSQAEPNVADERSMWTRVTAARALLEASYGPEYESLSAHQQARVQEAIEFLRMAESGFRGGTLHE